ncbi:MAG: SDR family NAD(P)-dependent oxidoreductase, partial [Rhodospirillales bacterium]
MATNPLFDLSGKTALVTGSTRGLGRAMIEGLARAGAAVVVNGTSPAGVAAAVAELRSAGFNADGVAFDVTDEAAIVAAFERFDKAGTAIDLQLNNAGNQFRKTMVELAPPSW